MIFLANFLAFSLFRPENNPLFSNFLPHITTLIIGEIIHKLELGQNLPDISLSFKFIHKIAVNSLCPNVSARSNICLMTLENLNK